MRCSRLWCLVLFACLLAGCAQAAGSAVGGSSSRIPLQACQLSSPGIPLRLEADCGQLAVAEDRGDPGGRQVVLHLAVLRSVSRSPAPDAVFFIPGGPGEAATQSYLSVSNAFERIRQKRDIVLVDQRGTGQSGALLCPVQEEENLSASQEVQGTAGYLQACLAGLEADPAQYTTEAAVADLEQVRAALGYPTINLYGGSYGTRVALAYLRRYPERVRTVILDGAAPPNWILGQTVAQDAQRALDLIFARCAADQACNTAFPDLPFKFNALLENLREEPLELSLADPVSGKPIEMTLTADFFASTIHALTYTPETTALLPLLIHTAYEQNEPSRIAAQGLANAELVAESISAGMRFSVICAEDQPLLEPAAPAEEETAGGYLGNYFQESFREICATWPRGAVPGDFHEPVRSDVPVLIISGEVDPVTPPANGDLAAQTLPNSLHVVVPGHGHINVFRGCLPGILTSFVENGTTQTLNTGCVQSLRPMPFFLSFTGPNP